ncbi:MAG: glycosyltransferase [Xanthobacteraceae bacterium]
MTTFLFLWLCAQAIGVALVWAFTIGLGKRVAPDIAPPVAVIVAVKGHDPEFDEFLVRLFEQDYPNFRVVFAVETSDDAAVPIIEKCRAIAPDRVTLVIAGRSVEEGQKTTNLLAALAELRQEDEILIFADADIWPERDWMGRLVDPLVRRDAEIVTGFPWLIVKDGKLASLILASIAAMVATIPRFAFLNGAWGGSTAIRYDQLRALDMRSEWKGVLSDDLQLTNVASRAGLTIAAPRELLMRTAISTMGFSGIIAEARRWYMLVRVHMPAAYLMTVIAMSLAALGWILLVVGILSLRIDAAVILLLAFGLAAIRTLARRRLIRALWGESGLAENQPFLRWDWAVAPLAVTISALCGWSALLMRRTTWAGVTYKVHGPQDIEILSRGIVTKA